MTFYRRNLPHWHPEGKAIFVTWRLFGSLPKGIAPGKSAWATSSTATPGCGTQSTQTTGKSACVTKESSGRRFRQIDAELDRGANGPLWLRDPKIAGYVEDAILRGEELGHYQLDTYVVMPNHVHVLLWPRVPLARITGGIKGVSARDANAALGRVGMHFWEDESFDHWVRNEAELVRIRAYIDRNPVSAGLVERPEDWPWSSAAKRSTQSTGRSACATSTQFTGKSACVTSTQFTGRGACATSTQSTGESACATGSTATPGCEGKTAQGKAAQARVPVSPEEKE